MKTFKGERHVSKFRQISHFVDEKFRSVRQHCWNGQCCYKCTFICLIENTIINEFTT